MQVGDGAGDYLKVNGIQLNWTSSLIQTTGSMSASGNVVATGLGSAVIAQNGYVQAGDAAAATGYIRMQSSGSGNSGYLEFWPGNDVRAGYIGNTGAVGSTDTGVINYVAATHAFTGNLTTTGSITAQGNVTAFSDERLKTEIALILDPVNKVKQLRGVNFTRKSDGARGTGLIAQDVQKVLPEAVETNRDGFMSVAYGNLVGLLVEAIKDQQEEIDELRAAVRSLLNRTA